MNKYREVMRTEASTYEVLLRFNNRHEQYEVHVRGKNLGRHVAVHTKFNLLDSHGSVITKKPINNDVGHFILNNFDFKGDTESFNIREDDPNILKPRRN